MRIFEGLVVSVGKDKSASVEITRRTPHALYKKLIKRSKKFTVDTTGFELSVGDKVKIVETKPISKTKYFKISEVVSSTKSNLKMTKVVEEVKSEKIEVEAEVEKTKAIKKVVKKKVVKGKTK